MKDSDPFGVEGLGHHTREAVQVSQNGCRMKQ